MSAVDSATSIAADVRAGRRRARDVLEEHLTRIDAREGDVHAFNLVLADDARARADEVDALVARGEDPGPLAGEKMISRPLSGLTDRRS